MQDIYIRGVIWIQENGYEWLKKVLLFKMESLVPKTEQERLILADAWYMIGELYDFNSAPKHAIQFYEKAIALNPNMAIYYREIANMYNQFGDYGEAFKYINIALEKDPDDVSSQIDRQDIQDNLNYNHESFYSEDNEMWQYAELLAAEQFDTLIQRIQAVEYPDFETQLCLCRAYAASGRQDEYIALWNKIVADKTDFYPEGIDWFYMKRNN